MVESQLKSQEDSLASTALHGPRSKGEAVGVEGTIRRRKARERSCKGDLRAEGAPIRDDVQDRQEISVAIDLEPLLPLQELQGANTLKSQKAVGEREVHHLKAKEQEQEQEQEKKEAADEEKVEETDEAETAHLLQVICFFLSPSFHPSLH